MLARGNRAVMDGKALFRFKGVGGLLLATSFRAECLAIGMLQAARSAAERNLMAIIPAQGADGVVGMAVGNLIFAGSASWSAVVVVLLGGSGAANLLEDLAVGMRHCDSDDLIVWAHLVTWGTDSLSWLRFPGISSSVVSALFATCNVAACILIVVVVVDVDDVNA